MIKNKDVWKVKKCDTKFSKLIRERDGKCLRCGRTEYLQCSHFWGRGFNGTRFDFDNCVTLCYPCHYGQYKTGWEFNKQGEYREFMISRLGVEGYSLLEKRARSYKSSLDARREFQENLSTAL